MVRSIVSSLMVVSFIPQMLWADPVICPLVPRQNYEELFKAVDTLGADMKKAFENCGQQTSTDMVAMLNAQQQLKTSATQLHQFWQDPTLAANDSTAFATNLTQAIGSVNSIGEALSNSSLIKGTCGQGKQTIGRMLLSLNDVVTSLAPLALLAGTLTTGGAAAVVPWVLGGAGLSSIVKVISSGDSNKPDMTNDENRELVMRAACEYTRIQQRIRYLTIMQKGDLEQLREDLRVRNEQLKSSLEKNPVLLGKINSYEERTLTLERSWKTLNALRNRFQKDNLDFMSLGDDVDLRCGFIHSITSRSKASHYPLAVLEILKSIGVGPDNNKRGAIFYAYSSLENQVKEKLEEIVTGKMKKEDCAALSVKWMRNMGLLLNEADATLHDQQRKMFEDLNKEPDYTEWNRKMGDVQGQKILLEKLLQFMGAKRGQNEFVDRAELNQRLNHFKTVLFGDGSIVTKINPIANKSQITAWLDHMKDTYDDQLKEFEKRYDTLDEEIARLVLALPLEQKVKISNGGRIAHLGLEMLQPEIAPRKTETWKNVCRSLDDISVVWDNAQDTLSYIELFCKTIADSIRNHQDLDTRIISMCSGKPRLDGTYEQLPEYMKLKKAQYQLSVIEKVRSVNPVFGIMPTFNKAQLAKRKQTTLTCTVSVNQ